MIQVNDSFKLKNLELKNRIVMPPMCMYSVVKEDGIPTDFHTLHYSTRALGGIALVILEATGINPAGRITDNCLGLWNSEQQEAFKPLVDSVKRYGSHIAIQLNHAGRKSTVTDGSEFVSSSPIPLDASARTPHELSEAEIEAIFDDFAAAAKRADEAGFDAIEIHAAHGYLINQFISPITNQRNDRYKDPTYFLKKLLERVHTVWPHDKVLMMRVSATDYEPEGYTVEDLNRILKPVAHLIDILHVSSGGITATAPQDYPGYQTPFADTLRKALQIPVIACGLILDKAMVLETLNNYAVDLVAIGRPLLRNPHWYLENFNLDIPRQYTRAFKSK